MTQLKLTNDQMSKAIVIEELGNIPVSSKNASKALKTGKDLSEPIKGL